MYQTLLPVLQADGGAGFAFLAIILLIMLVIAAVWIGISYWVYKDAKKRNMDNAAIWGIATFVIGIFGLILYILVRD